MFDTWLCNPWKPLVSVKAQSGYCTQCNHSAVKQSTLITASTLPTCSNYPQVQKQRRPHARRRGVSQIVCKGGKTSQGSHTVLEGDIPGSREEAIAQASEAVTAQLTSEKKQTKGFKGSNAKRLAVEVPVADTGPQATAQLAADLLGGLPAELAQSFTLVFADVEAALSASDLVPNAVLSLDSCEDEPPANAVIIVGASAQQAGSVDALLSRWRSRAVVLVNSEWGALTGRAAALAASFEVVYCFEPIAVRAFLMTTEGAVLRRAARGAPSAAPWLVYKRGGWGGGFKLIGRLPRRPNAQDLELVFYNNSAAESPITQGIKAVRGLTSKSSK